jgi:hypothetical protein
MAHDSFNICLGRRGDRSSAIGTIESVTGVLAAFALARPKLADLPSSEGWAFAFNGGVS